MTAPRWARWLVGFLAPPHREDDLLGDLEETHRSRVARKGGGRAWLLTSLEALDVSARLLFDRLRHTGPPARRPHEASTQDAMSRVGVSLLDFKLGLRMLVRFPALTVVSTVAIAFAITLGAGTYEFFERVTDPVMPFEEGHQIVNLRNRDLDRARVDPRALHDFVVWRDELKSFQDVGAWQSFQRNLVTDGGTSVPRFGAAVTAELLAIPRVPPLLGRLISSADEAPEAPAVVMLGHDVWRAQFGADPEVVGRQVHLGSTRATVIGVMPEGFGWPRSYQLWTAMQLDPLDFPRGEGPAIAVGARIAPGVDRAEAEAELAAIGRRTAADFPESHGRLRPELISFGAIELPISGVSYGVFYSLSTLAFIGLLVLVCGNVALLLFARTAAREAEIVVRNALGAGRGHIVGQLGVEALFLGGIAALMGLWGAQAGMHWVVRVMESLGESQFGFWFHEPIALSTGVLAVGITLVSAILCGVVPAMRVTGGTMAVHLQRAASGSGREFGRLWSGVIITQIAVTVVFVPLVLYLAHEASTIRSATYGFPAEEYLAVELAMGGGSVPMGELPNGPGERLVDAEIGPVARDLERRLLEDGVARATGLASQIPGPYHPWQYVDMVGPSAPPRSAAGHRVASAAVDPAFFETLKARIVAGRGFDESDPPPVEGEPRDVVVNEDFVRAVLEDRNPIGRRFRITDADGEAGESSGDNPSYEIVGVVEQIAMTIDPEMERAPGYYSALPHGGVHPLRMALHVGREPARSAPRVRQLAAEVNPDLMITDVRPMDDSAWQVRRAYDAWFWVVLSAGGIGVLLATIGIYSIMSFTVAKRTREIGVRVALGADHGRVLRGIFRRALRQIGAGIAIGGAILVLLVGLFTSEGEPIVLARAGLLLIAYLAVMAVVCGLACVAPTARALAVQPTDALKADG